MLFKGVLHEQVDGGRMTKTRFANEPMNLINE